GGPPMTPPGSIVRAAATAGHGATTTTDTTDDTTDETTGDDAANDAANDTVAITPPAVVQPLPPEVAPVALDGAAGTSLDPVVGPTPVPAAPQAAGDEPAMPFEPTAEPVTATGAEDTDTAITNTATVRADPATSEFTVADTTTGGDLPIAEPDAHIADPSEPTAPAGAATDAAADTQITAAPVPETSPVAAVPNATAIAAPEPDAGPEPTEAPVLAAESGATRRSDPTRRGLPNRGIENAAQVLSDLLNRTPTAAGQGDGAVTSGPRPIVAAATLAALIGESVEVPATGADTPDAVALLAAATATPPRALQAGAAANVMASHNTPGLPPETRIAVAIHHAIRSGIDRIRVQLWPAELGHVDLTLHVGRDNHTAVAIAVERPETLDLLQRDTRGLERALAEAGLRLDQGDLSFNLRHGGPNAGLDHAMRDSSRHEARPFGADAPLPADDVLPVWFVDSSRLVDIHA
ncbi:MAG: flagellar hook-length control protein FliK, partial [Alphaproteobacteria bacterium]